MPKREQALGQATSSSSRPADDRAPDAPRQRRAPAADDRRQGPPRPSADAPRRRREPTPARSTPRTPASASTPTPSATNNARRAGLTRPARRAARRRDARLRAASRATSANVHAASTRRRWSCGRCTRARRSPPAPSSAGSARPTELAPHVHFAIRPAGRGAPKIDPKPILDGWKLLEATAIYRAAGKNPFAGQPRDRQPGPADVEGPADRAGARRPAASRSTPAAARTSRPARSTAGSWRCSSTWSRAAIDLTITSLKCGHSILTTSGNVIRALDRRRRRHRPDQRHPGARPPGARARSPRRWSATCSQLQGTMKPAPDHQPDGLLRRRQHLRDGRPRRPRPRRLLRRSAAPARAASPSSSRRC